MGLLDKLKGLLFPTPQEPGELPPWIDRLQEAKYTSLSGIEVPFDYIDLQSFFSKKTAVFQNVNAPGAYIQDNGTGGFQFPMGCVFSGPNHDTEASTLLKALLETGEGTLIHPIFGSIVVIPVGRIEHVSALASAANMTTIMVEFFETTGLQLGALPPFDSLLDDFSAAAAADFAEKLNVDDVADSANFVERFTRRINQISNTLTNISSGLTDATESMKDVSDSLTRTMDVLIGQPLALARQTQLLIGEPARLAEATRARLEAYGNLARNIFGLNTVPTGYDFSAENGFHGDSLIASSSVAGAAESAFNNDFYTVSEFIAAAVELNALLDEFSTWSDNAYTAIGDFNTETQDTGDGWIQLQEYVSSVVSTLITGALTATNEVKITLDRERGTQELCYELYGTSKPDQLDIFASSNNFGGDEYFTLQEGREIVYFV